MPSIQRKASRLPGGSAPCHEDDFCARTRASLAESAVHLAAADAAEVVPASETSGFRQGQAAERAGHQRMAQKASIAADASSSPNRLTRASSPMARRSPRDFIQIGQIYDKRAPRIGPKNRIRLP